MSGCAVVSYTNPDADGLLTSLGYSALFAARHLRGCWAGYFGALNRETEVILSFCGLSAPGRLELVPEVDEFVVVDTHHLAQLPAGFPAHKVSLVLDHHPAGDRDAFANAEIVNESVGAAATLLFERAVRNAISIPREIACALAGAIMSNTLNFMAPSTTERDRRAFRELANIGGWDSGFSDLMREGRSSLARGELREVVRRDVKVFASKCGIVVISQLEVPSVGDIVARADLDRELRDLQAEHRAGGVVLNAVDLDERVSVLVVPSPSVQTRLAVALSLRFEGGIAKANRILLRKTDLVPALIGTSGDDEK